MALAVTTLWQFASHPQTDDKTAATLSDIQSIDELKERFAEDQGNARLILLLSPT